MASKRFPSGHLAGPFLYYVRSPRHILRLFCLLLLTSTFAPKALGATCRPAATPGDVQARIELARQSYFAVKYDDARRQLAVAEDMLTCTAETVPANVLHRLYLTLGAVQLVLDQPSLTRRVLDRAASVAPDLPWDKELGAKTEVLWVELRGARRDLRPVRLSGPAAAGDVSVAVDGEVMNADETRLLAPGEHFVQIQRWGEDWRSSWLRLEPPAAWRLRVVGEAALAEPVVELTSSRPRPGPWLTLGFGTVAVASGAVYGQAWLQRSNTDCTADSALCDASAFRGNLARDVFIPATTATVVSALFTLLLPALEGKGDPTASATRPRIQLGAGPGEVGVALIGRW